MVGASSGRWVVEHDLIALLPSRERLFLSIKAHGWPYLLETASFSGLIRDLLDNLASTLQLFIVQTIVGLSGSCL